MTDSTNFDSAEDMKDGDTNELMVDKIKDHSLPKRVGDADSGGAGADRGNSDEEKEHYTDDDEGADKRSQDEDRDCGATGVEQMPESLLNDHIESLNTEQPEDTATTVHKEQKESKQDAAEVPAQSDVKQKGLESSDGKCFKVKNENNEELHAGGDGPRQRTLKNKQNIAHLSRGDIHSHVETKRSPLTFSRHTFLYILLVFLAFGLGLGLLWYLRTSPPSVQKQYNLLEVFEQEIDKVQASFPSQRRELWRRTRIHLKRHLNLTDPTEPVSVILTSGREAEKTLGCLAQQLAAAFSNAHNSSVLSIDGTSKSAQNSDDVKLEIDKALKKDFEGGTQAAVIHRFEELPPGATLIFYRYCDHENSAFKKVFLAFTVMLQKEMAFPPNISLALVEEVVQEYLKEKFVSSDRTTKFNQMDLDKLSGLWSRISHLILPVSAEQKIEQDGCQT